MIKRQALFAAAWSATDILLRQGMQFAITMVLARLLVPADFGVVAMLVVFTAVGSVIADGGLTTALIQNQDANRQDESTAFWTTLAMGFVLALIMAVGAPFIAEFYGLPGVAPLARYMAIAIFANSAGAIHFALLSKQLEFKRQAAAGGIAAAVSGVISILMAHRGHGVWALATQIVLMACLTSVLLWILNPWRPEAVMKVSSLRRLGKFGWFHSINSLMEILYSRLYFMYVGRDFGATQLGYYANADTARLVPTTLLGGLIARVSLPMFSRASMDVERLRRGLQFGIRMTMLLMAPAVATILVLAHPIVELVFGRHWLPTAPLLQVMALASLLFPIHALNLQALLAQGHAQKMFKLEASKKILGVVLLVLGLKFGIEGVVWSQVAHSILALAINSHYSRRILGYGASSQLFDALPSLISATIAGIVVLIIKPYVALPLFGYLLCLGSVCALTFVLVLSLIGRETWRDFKDLAGAIRR